MAPIPWRRLLAALVCCLSFLTCTPRYENPGANLDFIAKIWIDPKAGFVATDVLGACAIWHDKGVGCELTDSKRDADYRVYADDEDCKPDKDGASKLAWMHIDIGRMVYRKKCFFKTEKDGSVSYDSVKFRGVGGHEFGHAFGVSWHVPDLRTINVTNASPGGNTKKECFFSDKGQEDGFEKIKIAPDGKPICGRALMNRYYGRDVNFITPFDSLSYDQRDYVPRHRFRMPHKREDAQGNDGEEEDTLGAGTIADCVVLER